MTHPNSLDLEAFSCGEPIAAVASHVDECAACSAFVERLRGATLAGPSLPAAREAVLRLPRTRPAVIWRVASVALPLAAAAILLVLLRSPSTKDVLVPSPPSTAQEIGTAPDPETTFKGGIQVAVIRERADQQKRFVGSVTVKPGDRLRTEVALDREQAILAAVLGDDASWLELMPEAIRRPGTHFSDRSARVDASPLRGTILVGNPEAVRRARDTKHFDGVVAIRVEWETP